MRTKFSLKESRVRLEGNNIIITSVKYAQGSKEGQEQDMVFEDVPEAIFRQLGEVTGEFWHTRANSTSKE